MKTVNKMTYKVWYRVTSGQGFVEITLFVEDANGVTLVSQNEGMFDSMKDAQYLVKVLEDEGNVIEYVSSEAYTGGED